LSSYYNYKHDPNGPLNNYAYYIYGVGHHTEDDCRPEDAFMQVYRPLYETAYAYRNGGMFDLRPLYMFYKPALNTGLGARIPHRLPDALAGRRHVEAFDPERRERTDDGVDDRRQRADCAGLARALGAQWIALRDHAIEQYASS